jgi:DNA-binding transcriptional LysR family regulator
MLADDQSISKVAQKANISQSALSQQINKFEKSLNTKLLIRTNKGVELTKEGEAIYKYAEEISHLYDDMQTALVSIRGKQLIRVNSCPSIADYALPCTLFELSKENPNHKYELITSHSDEINQNIKKAFTDVGFSYCLNTLEDTIECKPIGTNKLSLIAHPQAKIPTTISVEEFISQPFIGFPHEDYSSKKLRQNLNRLGYSIDELNEILEVNSIEAAKSSILRNYGIAYLPYMSVKEELYKKQFKEITVKDFDMSLPIYLITAKTHELPQEVEKFIESFERIGVNSFC